MQLIEHVRLMAEYNQWMNQKIYRECEKLSSEQLGEDRGAFFGSVLGTLNHLVVGDTVWLKRFSSSDVSHKSLESINDFPHPEALDSILFTTLPELKARREQLDRVVVAFARELSESELQKIITYKSFKGISSTKALFSLLMHMFNHQTHHRGQLTVLLSQFGLDVGVTDLVAIIPDV